MPTTQIITDNDGSKGWTTIERTFNENDVLIREVINYDNGRIRESIYDGVTGDIQTSTIVDHNDVYNWTSATREYAIDGSSVEYRLADDGVESEVSRDAFGEITHILREDLADAANWQTLNVDFHNGTTYEQNFDFDNGRERQVIFDETGFNVLSVVDTDSSNLRKWDSISIEVNGVTALETRTFDNGSSYIAIYELGVNAEGELDLLPTVKHRSDEANEFVWQSLTLEFDKTGERESRERVLDGEGPVAAPDLVSTDEDTLIFFDVLTNDTVGVPEVSLFSTSGTKGTVTHLGGGTFSYDPGNRFDYLDAGMSGTDAFVYQIEDLSGSDLGVVYVNINGLDDIIPAA